MTAPAISIIDALDDPALFGGAFIGPSWDTWRAILRAAFALPMNERDLALFRAVADRDPPSRPVRELVVIAGRRAGKDSIASAIAASAAAFSDYREVLRPGERALVACLACDRDQARIVLNYTKAFFASGPLAELVERETTNGMELSTGAVIEIGTNSFRAVRGRTIAVAVLDEVAFWRDETSARPDTETYRAIMPGLATIPGALLVMISTGYRKSGHLFDKYRKHYGKPGDEVLVIKAPSRTLNPTLDQRIIDEALEDDPDAAAAEWLGEFRDDISGFLDRELVDAAVDGGVVVRPARAGMPYIAGCDPSGGRGDSFVVAIAHADNNLVVLDALYERRAPFNPSEVVAEAAALLREYGVASLCGDKYAAGWVSEAFAKEGIRYVASERVRSDIYLDALPLFTAGRARLLDHARLVHQFATLERRTSRLGKDRVDHGVNGADDCANAAALALTTAATDAAPALIRASDLDGDVELVPHTVGAVMAVIWLSEMGRAGVVYFAVPILDGQPIHVISVDLDALTPQLFTEVAARLDAFVEAIRARSRRGRPVHAGLWVPRAFQPNAFSAMQAAFACYHERLELRLVFCDAIEEGVDAALLADPVRLHFAAAAHANAGLVKMSLNAAEEARSMPLMGALTARPGSRPDDDPVALALFTGVVLQFEGRAETPVPEWRGARMGVA